jgi:hypothetical protein
MTGDPHTWQPTLRGDEARRARELAHELALLLRDAPTGQDPALATGEAGRAVALAHLDDHFPGEGLADASMVALRAATRGVATRGVDASLMIGFTGVAWATSHLAAKAGAAAPQATAAADQALTEVLERGGWRNGFELVMGAAGVGVYALERLPAPSARRLLELVVHTLDELSEPADPGITWITHPEHLHPQTRGRAPAGYYNLGLAHGVPGPVGVLAAAVMAGVKEAGPLLDGAVEWMAAQTLPDDALSLLPYGIGDGHEPASARLAWCYGDPGAAAALLLAARSGHGGAASLAERAVERIVARPDETAGVQGASLCHGTAGLAHLCGRLAATAGDDRLAPVAARWVGATYELRDPAAGPGGFSVWDPEDEFTGYGDVQGLGLLGGVAGVALALAAAAGDADPTWDRSLLISLPPGLDA